MIGYTLDIAGYKIFFNPVDEKTKLETSPAQQSFLSKSKEFDLAINVRHSGFSLPPGAETVFRAPYVEEINGVQVKKKNKFWTVLKHGDYILILTSFPTSDLYNQALVSIRPGEKSWDLVIDSSSSAINPFIYPLDGLLLYYLTALNGDIFIHGSGVNYKGSGYLFSGTSGKGKSTMANLFLEAGGKVIHDDRLIIRKMNRSYIMFNTPVYPDEIRNSSAVDRIYLIEHCNENVSLSLTHTEAMAGLMSNCIQHHWNPEHIGTLTGQILNIVTEVPVHILKFLPDSTVVKFIEDDR